MGCVTGQNIPPKTFHPSQELQPLMQLLTELHERSGSAMDVLHSCCKDNQEIEEIIGLVHVYGSGWAPFTIDERELSLSKHVAEKDN